MTEQQKYRVLRVLSNPKVELREYEECVMADTVVEGSYGQATYSGFRPLVNYISRNSISMTAPVVQENADVGSWRISFVMPADKQLTDLPLPTDRVVTLRRVPAHTAVAIRFAGLTNASSIAVHERLLRAEISRAGLKPIGDIRIARFDPPWTPWFLRHNEIVLEVVEQNESSAT